MRKTYTPEQKAAALARVLAGEPVSHVATDMQIERTAIQHWLTRNSDTVTAVVTQATNLREDVTTLLHEQLLTLTVHARHYRSESWMNGKPESILESTRTVGSRMVAIMDRLSGQPGQDDDSDPS